MTTEFKYLQANQKFEQECLDAAKAEIGNCVSGIDYVTRLLTRAQEIKMERKAKLVTTEEVLAKSAAWGN